MTHQAWRCALAATLACLLPPTLHATGEPDSPPVSSASYSTTESAIHTPAPVASDSPDLSDRSPPPTPSPALSPSPTLSPAPSRPPAPDIEGLGRSLGYLTLFAAVLGAGIYFLKFGLPLARKASVAERKLQILETRPLGNRQYLLVVAYDDTRLLLGITPGKIDYLCPLDSPAGPKDFSTMMASTEKNNPPA